MNTKAETARLEQSISLKHTLRMQELLVKGSYWHCCTNCDYFDKGNLPEHPNGLKERSASCTKFKALPPPEVIAVGCEQWEETIPF